MFRGLGVWWFRGLEFRGLGFRDILWEDLPPCNSDYKG